MEMASSQFFIHLKRYSTYVCLLLAGCFFSQLVLADIGETHVLKQERDKVLSAIYQIESDSVSIEGQLMLDSLRMSVISLDERIFASYDESVDRLASQNLERGSKDKFAVYVALASTIVALFLTALLLMVRSRIQHDRNIGLIEMYRQLATEFLDSVSPDKTVTKRLLRVNVVVLVGLLMMSVSIVAYLLSTF